ncbi:MAG TPA: hypothetical protein VFH97_06590, partial [Gemmatimonadales bacterium]|nr:hypothetical protein [Gemmatimonadales bacterium]
MSSLSRRAFLRAGGVAAAEAAGAVLAPDAAAETPAQTLADQAAAQRAMLYDSTLCVGCRACEVACNEDNQLGRTTEEIFQGRPAEDVRALAPDVFTYVTFHQLEADPSSAAFGKVQCM